MATVTERHNPSFVLFPVNNNRTAWREFGLPILLVIPHARDAGGNIIKDSGVSSVVISIEDAPTEALVVGHDHTGLRYPDRELYRQTLTIQDLNNRQINTDLPSFTTSDGTLIGDRADVRSGDLMLYTTASGIYDSITYYEDADYYDISDVLIETEQLPPGHYNFIYSCEYNLRIVSSKQSTDSELICIDINQIGQAAFRFRLNHPGEVLLEFYNLTPPIYLTNAKKSTDNTVAFYRPFTDIMQDVFDEQKFIKNINWVNIAPYESIPYLSQLLGWDVPYFPESLDQLRRLILKKTKELQLMKGSRRAIRELLNLFGFTILFKHVWYSIDGERFIAPAESLPPEYEGQEITYIEKYQVEPILSNYKQPGFGDISANLLFRPQKLSGLDPFKAPEDSSDLTIDAYLVTVGSDADLVLQEQMALMEDDPDEYGSNASCIQDEVGFINIGQIQDALLGLEIIGHSQILVRGGFGIDQAVAGIEPPFKVVGAPLLGGINFNKNDNVVSLVFDHYIDFETDNTALYVIASYKRQDVIVPADMKDLRSNRFNIQILTRNGTDIRPDVLEFVLDFIHKIKAFHSLLDAIQYRIELTETYLVTDLCAGGDITQRYDTAIGRTQVPPAIIPNIPGESCQDLTPEGLGYKDADIIYRKLLLTAVVEEYEAWKALDSRESLDSTLLRLMAANPDNDRTSCIYNSRGQDRVIGDYTTQQATEKSPTPNSNSNSSTDHLNPYDITISGVGSGYSSIDGQNEPYSSVNVESDSGQQSWCELDAQTDYCYKGRVADDILMRLSPSLSEHYRSIACAISLGSGIYWTYPTISIRSTAGVKAPAHNSKTRKSVYSGGATDVNQIPLIDSVIGSNLTADPGVALPNKNNNFLGHKLRAYGLPVSESIHFSNRDYLTDHKQSQWLAIQRPSLDIQIPIMHYPGCRFPMMNKLGSDFTSSTWPARPWDDQYSVDTPCCDGSPTWLNAALVEGTNGNETLSFDSAMFTVTGNGLTPDIPGLGNHDILTGLVSSDVVHGIYSSQSDGHPAITLDDMTDCGTIGDTISVDTPLFSSASQSSTGGYIDYCDGYPSQSGYFNLTEVDLGRGGLYQDLFEALGIPGIDFDSTSGTNQVQLLFYLRSGIKDGTTGVRLDCGCQLAGSAGTDDQEIECTADLYINQDGDYDFNSDHIVVQSILKMEETIGAGPYILDGSIPSLMELIT